MDAAIGAASGLIGSVLNQLSNKFVEAYVASTELGLNSTKIKDDLMLMHGLLHEAQRRGVSDNLGLQGLLQRLRAKANEAEDALDELHYFIIQDQFDGTKHAVPDLGKGLRGHARHGRHAARNTVGNWLNCFSCSSMQDDGDSSAAVTNYNPQNATNLDGGNTAAADRLPFDRVVMSKKIKSVIEETHSLCEHVFKLLNIIPNHSSAPPVTLTRPQIGSTTLQDKLYGRSAIFEQTIKDMTSGTYHGEILSVLPIVGPGGIGKTTFAQHLYNDKRTQEHFTVGKIQHLEELKEFHVKKERVGFELEELGRLTNLGGELSTCNIEKVATKDEASKANLALKRNLKILKLVWGTEESAADADVIDGLQPHNSLRELAIINHSGAVGPPSWLCPDILITHLESLVLDGVSWGTLPPIGQLPYLKRLVLNDIARVRHIGPDSGTGRNQCFMQLKEVQISDMPVLETWTLEPTCPLFPVLESIEFRDCPSLLALPFLPDCSVSCTQDIHIHCPSLLSLNITDCPQLLLPLMPPAPSLTSIYVSDNVRNVRLDEEDALDLRSYSGAVAFHNMSNIVSLMSLEGSIISWIDPQKATSLTELHICGGSSMQSLAFISNLTSLTRLELINCENLTVGGFNPLTTLVSLKELVVTNDDNHRCSVTVDLFSEVATAKQLPAGTFHPLEKLAVDSISAVLVAPICSLLAATLHSLTISYDQQTESLTEEEEKSLQLLTSLETLTFEDCYGLTSLPQGLRRLSSLRNLYVHRCSKIQSLPKGGLPSSLYEIRVVWCSAQVHEEVMKLKGTNPELRVYA
ncbi:hypothetical protein ACQ4PT_062424 [Festuca glaucescens]